MKRVLCRAVVLVLVLSMFLSAVPASAKEYTVDITSDVIYGQGKSYVDESPVDLKMDVYRPRELTGTARPAVIFIHGGGFAGNDKAFTLFVKMCTEYAKAGYVAFSINYVLYPDQAYVNLAESIRAHATDDAEIALNHIRANAAEYGVDPEKILACGDSAGAAIAVALTYDNRCKSKLAGVIDLWGGMSSFTEETRNDPNSWSNNIYKYSIITNPTPCFIVHGDGDIIAPISVSYNFRDKLIGAKGQCDIYVVAGANHYPENRADEFIPQMLAFTRKVTSFTVTVQSDVVYGSDKNYYDEIADLKMDVYTPGDGGKTDRPAIMFIHGGGFNGSDKAFPLFVKMCTEFAQRGYVAFSINYNEYPGEAFADVAESCRQNAVAEAKIALEHIKANAGNYGIAADRIVVCGDSAGAAIAVALAFDNSCETDFAGLISLWGGMSSYMPETTDHNYSWSNPIYDYSVKNNPTPTLLVHGDIDNIAPISNSLDLKEKLLKAGCDCTMYTIIGGQHYAEDKLCDFLPEMFDFADKVTADYTITVQGADGMLSQKEGIRYNTEFSDIDFAEDDEENFLGWYKNSQLTQEFNMKTEILRDNITVYAAFKELYILGDASGDKQITILDALAVFKHIAQRSLLEGDALLAADVNKDTKIQIVDALQIFKYIAGKISSF